MRFQIFFHNKTFKKIICLITELLGSPDLAQLEYISWWHIV
jgi:hypothetical protein